MAFSPIYRNTILDIAIKPSNGHANFSESTLIWAVICSLLLHVLLAVVLPNFNFDISEEKPQPLTVEIMQPTPPAPVVLPEPTVQEPEPIKPEPIKKEVKPITEPIKPVKQKSPEPAPVQETEPTPAEPPPPAVITAAPKVDAPPVIVVPPPEPTIKTGPSEDEINAAKATFTENVQTELRRNHRYPTIAEKRGIQGEAKVKIVLDKEGNVVSVTIVESSGNDSLDQGAIATVKRSNLRKFYPSILQGRTYEITVPISFTIADS